ncbi:MAG: UbiA family prenyltransferase [Candidatus Thermoplasmatota archaeon]|jgi:geranylgeranylglycerol-phosphate geranylgeranyltransferase|nr:UbiA family prenyltransferase [Candidatus Thermoplasmatota archaeon]MEC8076828.1 UbiA family prenyltransferase [Candidatus Thermoplasmatota archaeon]MEC8446248.1 UbiA family prenyltransferase [Candidatus Thermoplasmatota archaeon]
MNPYIALTRPGNVVLTAVAVVAGSFIAAGDSILDFQVEIVIASLAAMMLVGGGNALNDYNDRESDKENHPNRPIPAGLINADEALVYSRILLSVGLLIVLFGLANKLPFIIALIGTVTLISYENNLKALGLSGNMAVGFMSGAVFLYAGMVVNDPGPTLWMFGLAFLATVAREIVKDIQDLEGDTDRFTLPARIGIAKSLFVTGFLLVVAWSLSFTAITQFSGMASNAYAIGVSIANVIMLIGFQNARNGDYFSGQKKIKQGMGVAMLAFIAAAGL